MAVATYVRSGGSTTSSFSLDIGTAGTDRLVAVSLSGRGVVGASAVTVDGKACNLAKQEIHTQGAGCTTELWYADESDLGASNGSVTVSVTHTLTLSAIQSLLYTGVAQTGPNDTGSSQGSLVLTLDVTNINCSLGGCVIAVWGSQDVGGSVLSSVTSPLTSRNQTSTSDMNLFTCSGTESSDQTNKTYSGTVDNSTDRSTLIVASWDKAPAGYVAGEINGVTALGSVNTVLSANINSVNTV